MKSRTTLEQHLSLSDVAGIFNCHINTIRNLVERGELQAVKVGRACRIAESSARQYLENNKKQPRAISGTAATQQNQQLTTSCQVRQDVDGCR
jgi:excisionase family DNA binding protein